MMRVTRELIRGLPEADRSAVHFAGYTMQEGLLKDPWLVAVASMLLCRARRVQAEPVFRQLIARWPTPGELARADTGELERILRPCGLHRNRARQLTRMSTMWLGDAWEVLEDLPGVGAYVRDAVGLFCFGCTEVECNDGALLRYVDKLRAAAVPSSGVEAGGV